MEMLSNVYYRVQGWSVRGAELVVEGQGAWR